MMRKRHSVLVLWLLFSSMASAQNCTNDWNAAVAFKREAFSNQKQTFAEWREKVRLWNTAASSCDGNNRENAKKNATLHLCSLDAIEGMSFSSIAEQRVKEGKFSSAMVEYENATKDFSDFIRECPSHSSMAAVKDQQSRNALEIRKVKDLVAKGLGCEAQVLDEFGDMFVGLVMSASDRNKYRAAAKTTLEQLAGYVENECPVDTGQDLYLSILDEKSVFINGEYSCYKLLNGALTKAASAEEIESIIRTRRGQLENTCKTSISRRFLQKFYE